MTDRLEYSTIFTELDALLDTRIASLDKMGTDVLINVIGKNYHNRLADYFTDIDNDKFKEIYDNRDKEILKNAILTPISFLILDYAKKTINQISSTPFHYKPKLIVNIYPYDLTDDEITNLIKVLIHTTESLIDISIVKMPYEEITPMYVKRDISLLILYNYTEWLELHSANKAFNKTTCPEVTLLGPGIIFKKGSYKNETNLDPFAAIETLVAPLIGLKLLTIDLFSFILPPKENNDS